MPRIELIFQHRITKRPLTKRVPLHGETTFERGFSTAPNGTEEVTYNVAIDIDRLEFMAHKACKSKGKVSHAGPLFVRIIKQRRLD